MANKPKWKNRNRDILKDIYDPTITDPPKPKLPKLLKELESNKKKLNKGGKV